MFNDYFRVRDLKEWLEKLPLEERSKCICVIGGDDTCSYLNLSTQDIDQVYEFEEEYSTNNIHKGLAEYNRKDDFESSIIRSDIKEVVVLDDYGYKMTAEDILRKIDSISNLDLPLFYDGLDLKSACELGIGWATKNEEGSDGYYTQCVLDTLEVGVWNWHQGHNLSGLSMHELEAQSDQEVPKEIDKAFVIELYDGGCLCDLDIWEHPW